MATASPAYAGVFSPSRTLEANPDEARCAACRQGHADLQIGGCGCLLHTTCLPLDVLFAKPPLRASYPTQQALCPCCRRSPIAQIRVLPLPLPVLEEAARMRERDAEATPVRGDDAAALAAGSPASSIALFNGTSHKRAFATKAPIGRSYRTGRWSQEESSYTDKLIKSFDAGLLPLPHGIKLNDFLCDLLSCRTSRLTKKLKNAKLSARTYRSRASGNAAMGAFAASGVGGDVQRSQTLFLKTITPEWVRMELQFNIVRMWRTHLANFCLQISYLQLDTKAWFASLDAVDHMAASCHETRTQARRKRMRSALAEDATAARTTPLLGPITAAPHDGEGAAEVSCGSSDREGVFVGGMPFRRLSSLNLKALGEEEPAGGLAIDTDAAEGFPRERLDSIGSILKESSAKLTSLRKFSFDPSFIEGSMLKHSTSLNSFCELFTPSQNPRDSSRRASSIDIDDPSLDVPEGSDPSYLAGAGQPPPSEVDNIVDEAINSVLASSNADDALQGLFLKEVSKFVVAAETPFQHVDLWVPMDVSRSEVVGKRHIGGSSTMATTSSGSVAGIIYGGQQGSSIRLSHAGHITAAPPQVAGRLNEFGMYSKNFSFSPGFGLPGRTYLSRRPVWEHNLSRLKPEQFARVGGAKIYGVQTSLCVPIDTPIGTMVVALYSTENLARDASLEKRCTEHFWKLKPEPKWKLTIDVGLSKTALNEGQEVPAYQAPPASPRVSSSTLDVIPPSPTGSKSPHVPDKLPVTAMGLLSNVPVANKKSSSGPPSHTVTEQSLALLLGKYMPLDRNASALNLAAHDIGADLMSIRLMMLRQPSCRTSEESKVANTIMTKYQNYAGMNMKEPDLIAAILNDWKSLSSARSAQPSFGLLNRVISGGQANPAAANFGLSPVPNAVLSNAMAPVPQPRQTDPSVNPFDDNNVGLPLAAFGDDALQSIANVAAYSEQNNVPRVVSEQGPIQNRTNEAS